MTAFAVQCKTCPWRVDCVPDEDIPNGYREDLHRALACTIQSGEASLRTALSGGPMHVMACHYSEPGTESYCAGWIENQIGPGNNIAVRLAVMRGTMPRPKCIGAQHETLNATLPKRRRR